MGERNIKVSEIVYAHLAAQRIADESLDAVLKRELGLNPTKEDLIAYLPDEIREYGRKIVEVIEMIGDFKTIIKDNKSIVFMVESLSIAEIEYTEENFRVRYRKGDGDMIYAGPAIYSEEVYKSNKEGIKQSVSGAYRRWGSKTEE